MKRFPILGVVLLIPALAILGIVGCEKKAAPPPAADASKGKAADNDQKPKAGGKAEITTPPDATVKGVVTFKGTPPAPKIDPRIEGHKEKDFCLSGPMLDKQEQTWIIGKDNGVADVIISLAPPSDKKFKKLDDATLKSYMHPVVIDQPYCNYVPHVVALYAEYQPLIAKNDAKVNHNVKIEAGAVLGGTKDFNLSPGKDTGEVSLKGGPETIISASCSIHTWMSSKIALFNNPYFAVTDKNGKFEIKNVPIDTELTVYLWHESSPTKVEVQKLTAKKGDNELKLEIAAK